MLTLAKKIGKNSELAGIVLESPLLFKGSDLLQTIESVECPFLILASKTDLVINYAFLCDILKKNKHAKIEEFKSDHAKIYEQEKEKYMIVLSTHSIFNR